MSLDPFGCRTVYLLHVDLRANPLIGPGYKLRLKLFCVAERIIEEAQPFFTTAGGNFASRIG